jgi:hypothetical protein
VRDLRFGEVLVVFADGDVKPPAGHDVPAGDRVFVRMTERDERVVAVEVRKREGGHPADGFQGVLAGLLQLSGEGEQLAPGRCPVEAADADVDGVDGPAADDLHQPVAGLLEPQPALQQFGAFVGHVQAAFVAEEVRGVQQVNVQRMALDPLAAVDEPPERGDRLGDLGTAGVLNGLARTHLVGDRADAADPRRDVGRLGVLPAAQQRLEEPGWLVDVEPRVGDLPVADDDLQAALALDPGQRRHGDRPAADLTVGHALRPPCGTGRRWR